MIVSNTGKYTLDVNALASGYEARLVAKWTSNDEIGEVDGKEYFKELDEETGEIVYVFLTGAENYYTFGDKQLTITNNNGVVTLNNAGNGFIANKEGTFDMTITSTDGSTRSVKCRVEVRVSNLSSNNTTDNDYAENFKNGISTIIDASVKNIIPDIFATGYRGNSIINITHADIPTILTVEVWDGEKYVVINEGFEYDGNAIEFENSMVGKQVRITIVPTYALNAHKAEQTLVVEYKLNDGVNVYNSNELFAAFGNTSISVINVLRGITAEVDPSKSDEGNPNYPLNKGWDSGIYVRVPTDNDNITINGNCYMIDASKVALFDPSKGGLHQDGYCAEYGYYYLNVHSGIFTYEAQSLSSEKNANIAINDLYIHGNFSGDSNAETDIFNDNKNILTGSQTYNGVIVRHGYLTMDNSRIDHTNVAVQSWGFDDYGAIYPESDYKYYPANPGKLYTKVMLSNMQIDVTFAQSVYAWGQVGIEVNSSYIGQSSGAAFHLSDSPILNTNTNGGYVRLSSDTTINNFVTGSEAWFVAFNKAVLAGKLKMGLNQGLAEFNLKVTQGVNEEFNFILMVDAAGPRFDDLDQRVENEESSMGPQTYMPYYPIYVDDSETALSRNLVGRLCGTMGFYSSDPENGMSILLETFPAS